MDITRNGSFIYSTNRNRYTKTGQLISDNSEVVVLDKNSPVIQFESDYVKSKIVNLFGGKVIPGEITEQEAELVDTNTFVKLAYKLFYKDTHDISFSEFKYFKNVTCTAKSMFVNVKLIKIEFPKSLNTFNSTLFWGTIFTNTTFIIPNSVNYLKEGVFDRSNLVKIIGPNVTEILEVIAGYCNNLESIEYPKLIKVNTTNRPYDVLSYCLKLKKIDFPNLEIIPAMCNINNERTITCFGYKCPELLSIDCPKLKECSIYTTSPNLQYINLGKISKLHKLCCENANPKLSITFDDYVDIAPEVFLKGFQLPNDANINYNTIKLPTIVDEELGNILQLSNTKFSTVPVGININDSINYDTYMSIDTIPNNHMSIYNINYPPILGFKDLYIDCKNKELPLGIVQSPHIKQLILNNVKQINTAACTVMPNVDFIQINATIGTPITIKDFAFSSVVPKNFSWSTNNKSKTCQLSDDCIINGDNPFFGPSPIEFMPGAQSGDSIQRLHVLPSGLIYGMIPDSIFVYTKLITVSSNYNYNISIPNTITEIAGGAFGYNQNTEILHIPANIKKIGYLAFAYSKIKEFHFEDDIKNIEFVRTGYDVYDYDNPKQGNYSPFYGMDNPKFYIKGREATKEEIQILLSNQNINTNEYITTKVPGTLYSSDYNVQVPLGVKAYTYKLENGQYVKSKTYTENQIIPKGEPVVLEGQPDTYKFYTVNYTSEEKDKNNILVGTESDIETNVSCYIFDNGTIEISSAPTLIKENTVYIKKEEE